MIVKPYQLQSMQAYAEQKGLQQEFLRCAWCGHEMPLDSETEYCEDCLDKEVYA